MIAFERAGSSLHLCQKEFSIVVENGLEESDRGFGCDRQLFRLVCAGGHWTAGAIWVELRLPCPGKGGSHVSRSIKRVWR